MNLLMNNIKTIFKKHPILRGMASYALVWPTSNLVQQSMDKSRLELDYREMFNYFVLGTFATAPTVYAWMKTAGVLVKGKSLRHAFIKAGLDAIIFSPIGQTQFYFGITILEGKSWDECVAEWKNKLIPTWKVAICFWPIVQTINFAYIPERNRVVIVSLASFIWTIFLSYMHHSKLTGNQSTKLKWLPINENKHSSLKSCSKTD